MRIEFQNTLDDYREANGVYAKPAGSGKPLRGIVTWLVIALMLLATWWILTLLDEAAEEGSSPFPWRRLAIVLGPSAVLWAVFCWFVLRQFRQVPQPWNPPPEKPAHASWKGLMGWIVFVVLATVFFMLLQQLPATLPAVTTAAAPPERLPVYFEHLLPLLSWFIFILLLLWASRVQRTRGMPMQWSALRHEHDPRVLTTSDSGITIEQPAARVEYRWDYFAGYRETQNLILLYTSPYGFYMIPKRAFGTEEQLVAFKASVMTGIPRGHFLPTGTRSFQVVPVAAAQPAESR